jgi:hypothetical protein
MSGIEQSQPAHLVGHPNFAQHLQITMAEPSKRRAEIISELHDLSVKHDNAVQDATFMGWQPDQLALDEKRSQRIALLRTRLATLDED